MANEGLPTITINCGCEREICTVSLNIGGMRGTLKCECGAEYIFKDSLIPQDVHSMLADHQPICTVRSGSERG